MNNEKTQFPILKWAQRKDRLFITINVVHSAKPTVDVVDGKKVSYKGTDGKTQYAFEIDANFLNYENNFMTLEELEIVISTLENDIGHGELIPRERISQLILSIYPDKADYVKKLTDVIFIYNISLSYLYIIIVFFDKTRGLQKIPTQKVLERAETLR